VIQGNTSSSSDPFPYGNVTETTDGQQHQAEAKLCSATQCWRQWIQPYYDAAFGTFAFVPLSEGSSSCERAASASGVVSDAAGLPIANQTVELTFDDGRRRPISGPSARRPSAARG
jgi:hypothetical protein